MKTNLLQGTVCANITPLNNDGCIDYPALRSLVNYLIDAGINGLYPNGTNGEGILLSLAERRQIAETIIDEAKGRIPVVIQCGAQNVEDTMALARHAADVGADGIGVMTPYFFHHDDEALYRYFLTTAESVPALPVYIYNIPSHTNNDVTPPVASRLFGAAPNIAGMKYSFSDLLRLGEYIRINDDFHTLIGCDRLMLPALTIGAVGAVSGPAAICPELFRALWQAWQAQDLNRARCFQTQIAVMDKGLAAFAGIPLIKAYLQDIGVIGSICCRSPFRSCDATESRQMVTAIKQLKQSIR